MASRNRGGGVGDRVLEGRHVIGLFILMLLFSGVFFTLGYVMGRNQYSGQVRAATGQRGSDEVAVNPGRDTKVPAKADGRSRHPGDSDPAAGPADSFAAPYREWEFYHAGEANKASDRLKPAESAPKTVAAAGKPSASPKPPAAKPRTSPGAPLLASGAYLLQVAALSTEGDALVLAETLQKKNFPAFVVTPGADKFYRVQVGPYADQKSVNAAKKGLENAGFKAIVKH